MLKTQATPRVRLGMRGDTIVEVLIAIAIVSLILGGAFVATNRSLMATRDAEERSDGLKLVEGQIEQLKNLAAVDADEIFGSTPASYCISGSAAVDAANAACKVNAAGTPTTTGQPLYSIAISRSGNTFTVRNTWDTSRGAKTSLQMKYRVYD
jgi:prepilin-type N-terminal cleavage/methylation domain-containing protein